MSAIDCTAPSLHIGNLLPIMMLHWLQQTGNKPIALMGGGTTMVGDPSGKDETRAILHRRGDRSQQGLIRGVFAKVPALRRWRAATRSCSTMPNG